MKTSFYVAEMKDNGDSGCHVGEYETFEEAKSIAEELASDHRLTRREMKTSFVSIDEVDENGNGIGNGWIVNYK